MVHVIPKKQNLIDCINYNRRKGRPTDLKTINFVINFEKIQQHFFRSINQSKHIILMSEEMIINLEKCRVGYIDGTFRIINKPFKQLLGIHYFSWLLNIYYQYVILLYLFNI